MGESVIILEFLIIFFKAGLILSAEWETKPADVIQVCQGENVRFPWKLHLKPQNEFVENMYWVFHNASITDLIATYLYGQFFPSIDYAGRISQWQETGVTVHNVTHRDTGNYSVQVEVRRSNESNVSHLLSHSVHLLVSDVLLVEDGRLKVTQDPVAVWNTTSRQWLIRLTCGVFLYKDTPPMHVEWIFPNGETLPSDGFESGHFYLSLNTSTVRSGKYTCRIPPQFFSQVCITGNHSAVTEQSIVIVDIRVRLVLAEAEKERLGLDNERLEITVDNLNNSLSLPPSDLPSICMKINYTVINDVAGLRNLGNSTIGSLCDRMNLGWYRWLLSGHDAVIPTWCTPIDKCGTQSTMWIDLAGQPMPAVGRQVRGRACANWQSNCCRWETPSVTVRNCGSYYLYQLPPAPYCDLAYCLRRKI